MDRTDESLVAIRRIMRATELFGRRLAQEAGLTAVQLRVLQIVAEQGHATPTEIAMRMGVTQATVSALIKKLEKFGMLERKRSEVDRRQTNLHLTDLGRDKVKGAPDALQQRYVQQFEALEDWEQAMTVAILERVASMLDAEKLDASPVLSVGEIVPPQPDGAAPVNKD
ncbi:MarR family winged helix-turn-helix transcriptional regulator [Tropicibacter oceani]|uniref:MarR family transcriptional regulator n=1 Tax=Tropicibacter oceani TaxID=3058420 RepID=A0ABY8QFZ1_9RHOB|nr:MarR family transcriptional regulator [Tropicibacter oceani]WGW03529.1 MarR family transcriptional regulator [Tropicibacter oceani]